MNKFALLAEEIEEVVEKVVESPPKEDDSMSLDSTGRSWADLDDEFSVKAPKSILTKPIIQVGGDFTKVSHKKKVRFVKNPDDIIIKCINCNQKFTFPGFKVKSYESKGWNMPKRCKECLGIRKEIGELPKHQRKTTINIAGI